MRRRKKQHELEDIVMDLTPMIDVVFQLLIFFMVATKFKTLEGKLLAYLPKQQGIHDRTPVIDETLPIRVGIHWNPGTRQARVYVGQSFMGLADQGGLRKAKQRVRQILATGTNTAEIDAVPGCPYKYVVETLDMLIDSNVTDIMFAGGRF